MKKIAYPYILLMVVLIGSASLPSCQKARLVDEWPDGTEKDVNGRNSQAEPGDSTTVKPNFETEDWEGTIDINFGYGSEETE